MRGMFGWAVLVAAGLLPGGWAADAPREGAFVEKWPGDLPKIEGFYKDGELSGPYNEYFENGRIKLRAGYTKGRMQGPFQAFFEDGKNHIQCSYAEGLKEGVYQEFAPGGKLKILCGYAEGLLHGKYTEYAADGRTVAKEAFYIYGAERFGREKQALTSLLTQIQTDTLKAANLPVPAPVAAPAASTGTVGGGRGGGGGGRGSGGNRGGGSTGGGAGAVAASSASPAAIADALVKLKQARAIAGVPYADITLKESYNIEAQAAADLLAQLGELNHNPPQPAGMSDEKYRLALAGCQHGNLAMGMKSLSDSVLRWMYDSDDHNKDEVGHRRWCLNPTMVQTGFGQNGKFITIWAHDSARTDIPDFTTIPWPAAGYHPAAFFGPQWCWSVSLNPQKYAAPEPAKLKVAIWALDKNYRKTGAPLELNHYVVNTEPYGVRYAVIFRPKTAAAAAGNSYLVQIQGLKTSAGEDAPYTQVTEFY